MIRSFFSTYFYYQTLLTIVLLLFCHFLPAQRTDRVNKHAIGVKMNFGHVLPNFDRPQDQWKAVFYPTASLDIDFVHRLSQTWILNTGVGATSYALINKGPRDRYILDFMLPHFSSGISYNYQYTGSQEHFFKLTAGAQMGYKGSFLDEFDTYSVAVESQNNFYYFIRPELGTRRFFKRKAMGSRYRTAYEFGTYLRYHLNSLGTATFASDNFEVVLSPTGTHLGIYYRILFPVGQQRVKTKPVNEIDPIIYNPRDLK